jgi:hypothetical protein
VLHFKKTEKARTLREVTGVEWPEAIERCLEAMLASEPTGRFRCADDVLEAWRGLAMMHGVPSAPIAAVDESTPPSSTLV